MKNYKNVLVGIGVICLLFFSLTNILCASEKFPSKEIKIIIPMAPGGGTDLNARAIQPHAEKELGVPLVVTNMPGGALTVGTLAGARAAADGYTITGVTPTLLIAQYTTDVGIDYKAFEPIIQSAYAPSGIVVKGDSRWNTIEEFIDYAKENPGMITISTSGPGALWHICGVGIEEATGAKFTYVPYTGGAPAAAAVAGGHVDATTVSMGECSQLVESGMLKGLAVTSPLRYKFAPDVPTFKEKGYDLDLGVWWGYVVPKGTPKDVINILYNAFEKAVETQEFKKFLDDRWIMYREMSPEEFQKFLDNEDVQWKKFIYSAGVAVK